MAVLSQLKSLEISELHSKFNELYEKVDVLCREVGPKIKIIGELREEMQLIYQELNSRGEVPKYNPPTEDI